MTLLAIYLWAVVFLLVLLASVLWITRPLTAEELEAQKHRKEEKRMFKLGKRAAKKAPHAPDAIHQDIVLGVPIMGDLFPWVKGGYLTYPTHALGSHCVIIGGSGSGKTETLLRIAVQVAKVLKWKVIYIDAKGDYDTLDRFIAAMTEAGIVDLTMFPAMAYDGFRGDPAAILNRLMSIEEFTEPHYKNITKLMLDLAIKAPPSPPRTSQELLQRLHLDVLAKIYKDRPEMKDIAALKEREAMGAYTRYRAFFGAINGVLDGKWAFEDCQASYVLLDGLALREEASSLGRFLIEDFSHFIARRKPSEQRVLFIVDELSALTTGSGAANLFERIRSFGGSVLISSQSYAGLGDHADRILDAAKSLILHQSSDPERLVARAGTRRVVERSTQLNEEGPTGMGSYRNQHAFRVDPDAVRRLGIGEAFLISNGHAHKFKASQATVHAETLHAAHNKRLELETLAAQKRTQTPLEPAIDSRPVVDLDAPPAPSTPRAKRQPKQIAPKEVAPQPNTPPTVIDDRPIVEL